MTIGPRMKWAIIFFSIAVITLTFSRSIMATLRLTGVAVFVTVVAHFVIRAIEFMLSSDSNSPSQDDTDKAFDTDTNEERIDEGVPHNVSND
jgi:hypothetical protein